MHEILPTLKRGLKARVLPKQYGVASAIHKQKRARRNNLDPQQPPPHPRPVHRDSHKRSAETGARASFLKARDKLTHLRARSIVYEKRRSETNRESRSVGFGRLLKSQPLTGYLRDTNHWLLLEPFERERNLFERGEVEDSDIILDRMHSWVQILTTPTADTPGTTLLLHFDSKRYLIGNVAEGTQRAAIQRNMSLTKVKNIFLTGKVDWSTTGGLIGMILTLADVTAAQRAEGIVSKKKEKGNYVPDAPKLNIHGGKNLTHLLATTRRFVFRKGMPVNVNEFKVAHRKSKTEEVDLEATWKDENISVWAMSILPDNNSTSPLKRKSTHDEISEPTPMAIDTALSDKPETIEERDDGDDQIRRGVVGHMFDSDWRLDALVTKKLADVRMPAAIFVRNSEGKIEKYRGLLPGGNEVVPDIEVLVRNPWPGAEVASLPSTTPSAEAMSYIVKNHPQRGRFNPKSAKELGVQPGPQFRQLTMGQSVTTADGKVVTPDMVMAPGKTGGGFAVVELPSELYIDNLLKREEWNSQSVMDGIGGIVWILGKGLSADDRLSAFRKKFAYLQHVISSSDVCSNHLALESPATAAIKLHLLDSDRFPIPVHSNERPILYPSGIDEDFQRARVGVALQLEPSFEVQDNKIIGLLNTVQVQESADDEVLKLAEEARKAVNDPNYQKELAEVQKDIPSKDAEVITLGTGSALPSKYRNVSATLLRVPGYGNYLLDCGENTLGQLKRVFGAGLPQVLRDLKLIWISHLHADHHLGTASVIKAWHEETRDDKNLQARKLMIASDEGMLQWLTEYSEVEDYGFSRLQLQSMDRQNNYEKQFDALEREIYGLSTIKACPVNHCHGALAVVLTLPNGFKAAYSGDCLPSSDFAKIGKGATLLIHEATFDDELAGDALAKKHSTTSDALFVGKEMGARRILLTHFSQRYQKIPVMDSKSDQVAIVAFDYMRCLLGDFAKLAHFRPALLKLYEEKEEDKKV